MDTLPPGPFIFTLNRPSGIDQLDFLGCGNKVGDAVFLGREKRFERMLLMRTEDRNTSGQQPSTMALRQFSLEAWGEFSWFLIASFPHVDVDADCGTGLGHRGENS